MATTKILKLVESTLANMKIARCVRRIGGTLATIPLPLAAVRLIPDAIVNDWLPWFDKDLAGKIVVALIGIGIVMYVAGVILFIFFKGRISLGIRAGDDFIRINEAQGKTIERLRTLGAQGETASTFVSAELLATLLSKNPDYVQAWGKPADGDTSSYSDVCFFVVAPLTVAGVNAMRPDKAGNREIQRNRDLKEQHIEASPKRCAGLYIIELFGDTRLSRGAASSKLLQFLNDEFSKKFVNQSFRIFARPATVHGSRVTKHYSFRNLGTGERDMHEWQAPEEGQGLCNTVLSAFATK